MIHIEEPSTLVLDNKSMSDYIKDEPTLTGKIAKAMEVVKALPINGCITGSCLLPDFDPELWGTIPDIDLFVYSENDLVKACTIAEHKLRMTPGQGTSRSKQQEEWKLQRLYEVGLNYKLGITTYKFFADGIILNITFKQSRVQNKWVPLVNAPSVLYSFDMSIIMQAYDIQSHVMFDLRPDNVPPNVAIPNPLRKQDCMIWTVSKWIRQFDRVVKYYSRGYDTRPMAKFYLDMIDTCIDNGCMFDSEESHQLFEDFSKEFLEAKAKISDWLEEHIND